MTCIAMSYRHLRTDFAANLIGSVRSRGSLKRMARVGLLIGTMGLAPIVVSAQPLHAIDFHHEQNRGGEAGGMGEGWGEWWATTIRLRSAHVKSPPQPIDSAKRGSGSAAGIIQGIEWVTAQHAHAPL